VPQFLAAQQASQNSSKLFAIFRTHPQQYEYKHIKVLCNLSLALTSALTPLQSISCANRGGGPHPPFSIYPFSCTLTTFGVRRGYMIHGVTSVACTCNKGLARHIESLALTCSASKEAFHSCVSF
jgi:hypothetical protein